MARLRAIVRWLFNLQTCIFQACSRELPSLWSICTDVQYELGKIYRYISETASNRSDHLMFEKNGKNINTNSFKKYIIKK